MFVEQTYIECFLYTKPSLWMFSIQGWIRQLRLKEQEALAHRQPQRLLSFTGRLVLSEHPAVTAGCGQGDIAFRGSGSSYSSRKGGGSRQA